MTVHTRDAFASSLEIAELVQEFEAATLPPGDWNHEAHLTVALWYLFHNEESEAARRMICGLRRYNHARGITARPGGGYHETLTMFWLSVVRAFMRAHPGMAFVTLTNALILRFGDRKDLAGAFYSPDRLWSADARGHWIQPDVRNMDDLVAMM